MAGAVGTPIVLGAVRAVDEAAGTLLAAGAVAAAAAGLVAVILATLLFPDPLHRRLRTLAHRLPGADFKAARPPRHPLNGIHFFWGHTWMELTAVPGWFGATELRLEGRPVPPPPFALRVCPRRRRERRLPIFHVAEVPTGAAWFDYRYLAEAFPAEVVPALLDEAGRRRLLKIGRHGRLRLEVTPVRFLARLSTRSRSLATAEAFVAFARELLEAWLGGAAYTRGVQVLGVDESAPDRCPVCRSALEGPIAVCRGCETPHHRECWIYNGLCARFGCGHRRWAPYRRRVA
jgi:hypothetical protein